MGECGRAGEWECGRAGDPHTPTPPHPHTPIPPYPHTPTLVIALLTILAAALRLVPYLADYPLHRDEALYGFWARLIASGRDPLLLTTWIDKPPLVIYLLAAALKIFGVSNLALRVPGLLAGVLLIPATYALARRVYDPPTATLAALLVAASPFAILFAPTAFTDPWLTLWLVVSAWAAVSGRPFWAGLTLGLAVASKQQGVLVAPLVIGLLIVTNDERRTTNDRVQHRWAFVVRHWSLVIFGFALILAPLTYWDSLRWHNRPSFWDRSLTTYGGIALAPLVEWPQRAFAWAGQLGYLWGAPLLSLMVLGLAVWGGARKSQIANRHLQSPIPNPQSVAVLAAFVLGYLALHFVLTFQVWDRYLLPLAPLVSILAARGAVVFRAAVIFRAVGHAGRRPSTSLRAGTANENSAEHPERSGGAVSATQSKDAERSSRNGSILRLRPAHNTGLRSGCCGLCRAAVALTLTALLGYAAWLGVAGQIPVGSDHGAYTGLARVVAVVAGRPADAVIYHQSLGWYFDFYLFDAPQERRWFDTPARLVGAAVHTAGAEPAREQWLVAAEWERDTIGEIETALTEHGLKLTESERIYRPDGSRSFTLYHIIRPEVTDGG